MHDRSRAMRWNGSLVFRFEISNAKNILAAVASPSESQPPVHLSQTQINQLLSLLKITGNDQPLANFAGPDDEEDFCDG
ncbi:unnamed protein product [Trifolium pratense]|uniref:Uncharacterized protein n=1 Tax=Trifolium pratense TaxID=57577 RepID=A0ACB0LVG5_TRIPR|nr:unnamed protein product [Trifolium pratense]